MLRVILPLAFISILFSCQNNPSSLPEQAEDEKFPSDYMFQQRAFPEGKINREAYKVALLQAAEMRRTSQMFRNAETWENVGPTNIGGRIAALAADPTGQTIYAGVASGGVWKTTDDGVNWTPIFDDAPTLSIGDLAVASSQSQTIYVGTGESNAGGGSLAYDGLGVFKTSDAGDSWAAIGLEEMGSIGKVVIHPTDPNTVYVAAMGYLFEDNSERGVYRTQDGGLSWEKVLFVNDSTGAIDMAMHPTDPNIVYAATWERVRRPNRRHYGGPGCGIWRTTNGGDTWTELQGGLPQANNGRIGLAVTPDEPDMLLALYESESGTSKGVYRSYNKGDDWQAPSGGQGITYPGFGWWFGKIFIDPSDKDKVFALGLDVHRSTDGALNFTDIQSQDVHVDQHALYIDPNNSNRVILGNDGGIYVSYDGGDSWEFRSNIPITQFYTCEIDYSNPERLYGGTQDNGTWRTLSGAADGFEHIIGGDGFYAVVNPEDPNFIMGESQHGGLVVSSNGGDNFQFVGGQINGRKNWNMPVVLDPNDPDIAYSGSHQLYKSINNGFAWASISGDLTTGPPSGNLVYASITTISVSPHDGDVIWVGTDDGNVQVTTNGGGNWVKVSDDLPVRWVTRVVADPHEEGTAYVTFSGYRYNDYLPHVFRTADFGNSWEDISGNLPEAPVNDLIVDPTDADRLFLATDVGVFESINGGESWEAMGEGMPAVPVTDLRHHDEELFMIAATYGRSFYKIKTGDPVSVSTPEEQATLMSVQPNPIVNTSEVFLKLSKRQVVQLGIYDLQGRKVAVLFNGTLDQGKHVFNFNKTQIEVAGTYFIRAYGEHFQEVEKVFVK